MYKELINKKGNKFYSVKEQTIIKAQENLGITFPKELQDFYIEVGYGFLKSERMNFNRIMDPISVSEFRLREGQFSNNTELDMYDKYERDKLIFFEICEGCYLSIGFSKGNKGAIFDGNKKICKNLKEFLINYQDNELFFMK